MNNLESGEFMQIRGELKIENRRFERRKTNFSYGRDLFLDDTIDFSRFVNKSHSDRELVKLYG